MIRRLPKRFRRRYVRMRRYLRTAYLSFIVWTIGCRLRAAVVLSQAALEIVHGLGILHFAMHGGKCPCPRCGGSGCPCKRCKGHPLNDPNAPGWQGPSWDRFARRNQ